MGTYVRIFLSSRTMQSESPSTLRILDVLKKTTANDPTAAEEICDGALVANSGCPIATQIAARAAAILLQSSCLLLFPSQGSSTRRVAAICSVACGAR